MGSCNSKNSEDSSLLETLADHTDSINCMTIADDESVLVTGSEDKTARMWTTQDPDGSECLGTLEGHTGYVTTVHVFDTIIITGSSDKTIRKWDMTTCECDFIYSGHTAEVMQVICTGDYIISSAKDKTAKIWIFDTDDLEEGEEEKACIRTFKGHLKTVHPLIYIPSDPEKGEEELVITGSTDHTARLWSIDSGSCLQVYKGHTGSIMTMATDLDARILFTGSTDSTIRSWDIRSSRLLKIFSGHTTPIMCLSVVNKLMYTGDTAGVAKCWAWNFGDCTKEYKGHKHSITCLKFFKGILYTGCGDGDARAFEAKSGLLTKTFKTKESAVVINCLGLCNHKLFTGGRDGKLRVWDITKTDGVECS
ncbi:WD repeat-containing protein 86-like [Homarus americanus]|uniref:WD repeat-containing protein 86-like n=1 Tax=Homarus americanus TaxID=6706 RepID=UPI001C467252|nr:WD repeat-containing protein 86-like [Homarus americanus]